MLSYAKCTTVIESNGKTSRPIPLTSGFKQGGSLSSVLLNWFIHEVVTAVEGMDMGVELGNERTGTLVYANDLVLVPWSSVQLAELIRIVTSTLEKGELEKNAG